MNPHQVGVGWFRGGGGGGGGLHDKRIVELFLNGG